MVTPPALVHRLQSRSMKDLVHLLLPRVWFTCTTWSWSGWSWSELGGAARNVVGVVVVGVVVVDEGKIPCFFPGVLPPAVRSLASSRGGASVRLG